MEKEIRWTPEAEQTFEHIIKYLRENWSEKEVENFVAATEEVLAYISQHPLMFRKSKKKKIHEALITKHNLLIYRVKKQYVELLTFWDTRRNPRSKLQKLK